MEGVEIYDIRAGSNGRFSEVLYAQKDGVKCLAKIAPTVHMDIFKNEVSILRRIEDTTYLPRFITALVSDAGGIILMSDCGKDLDCIPSKLISIPCMLDNISRGLETLHHMGFVHCDVKPSNITCKDGVYTLIDLGFCCSQSLHYTSRGALNYCSIYVQLSSKARPIDDLISLVHVAMKKQVNRLPWSHCKLEEEIVLIKRRLSTPIFTEEWAPFTKDLFLLYAFCNRQHQRMTTGEQSEVVYAPFRQTLLK